jgi:hypothetical protein
MGYFRRLSLAALLLAGACVISPVDEEDIGSISSAVPVYGYHDFPSATLALQVKDPATGQWVTLAQTTSAASPSFPAGYFTGGPALHFYDFGSRVIPAAYWGYHADLLRRADVRVIEGDFALYTGESGASYCVYSGSGRSGASPGFFETAYGCGFDETVARVYGR